jgi:hypothetical protein
MKIIEAILQSSKVAKPVTNNLRRWHSELEREDGSFWSLLRGRSLHPKLLHPAAQRAGRDSQEYSGAMGT